MTTHNRYFTFGLIGVGYKKKRRSEGEKDDFLRSTKLNATSKFQANNLDTKGETMIRAVKKSNAHGSLCQQPGRRVPLLIAGLIAGVFLAAQSGLMLVSNIRQVSVGSKNKQHDSSSSKKPPFPARDYLFSHSLQLTGLPLLEFHTMSSTFEHPIDSKARRKPRVYWTVLAGRRSLLELQKKYIKEALESGVVDEVHVWDYTARTPNEDENRANVNYFADDLATISPKVSIVWLDNESCPWEFYYRYYAQVLRDDDVLLKVDDDIIFADTAPESKRLASFIAAVRSTPEVFLWSANVVNCGEPAVFQTQEGMLQGVSVTREDESGGNPYGVGTLHKNSTRGLLIHKEFLAYPERFFRVPSTLLMSIPDRLSINFLGILGVNAGKASRYVDFAPSGDDEFALSVTSTFKYQQDLVLFTPFVAAHASFGPQSIYGEVVSLYKNATIPRNDIPFVTDPSVIRAEYHKLDFLRQPAEKVAVFKQQYPWIWDRD